MITVLNLLSSGTLPLELLVPEDTNIEQSVSNGKLSCTLNGTDTFLVVSAGTYGEYGNSTVWAVEGLAYVYLVSRGVCCFGLKFLVHSQGVLASDPPSYNPNQKTFTVVDESEITIDDSYTFRAPGANTVSGSGHRNSYGTHVWKLV